jgi:hypothetical protein
LKAFVSQTIEDEQFIVAGTIRMEKRLPDREGKPKVAHIAVQLSYGSSEKISIVQIHRQILPMSLPN